MIIESIIHQLPSEVRLLENARLGDYTTFRLGGTCPALVECPSPECLASAAGLLAAEIIPFIVIGQGSNLLVSDEGLDSVVLRYCSETNPSVEFMGCRVRVSGNTLLDDLARLAIGRGLGDISYCSGIPGTIGGAIAGNAGAFGQQIGDVVESVRLMEPTGEVREVEAEKLQFEYRSSMLKQTGAIILDAVLKLKPADLETMQNERERIMELRRSKHPDWKSMPCAGSVFRNVEPTSAAERRQAAGWFLEEAGAKDFRVGGAHLFEKHANIIIADPEATASDVFNLTEKMIAAVREKFGFELVREIKLLGRF
ncbi:UDP-N-acetylenolpyruvoylglucosamine reductase [Pontiella desulfatans]|uniref:UDP-N-acetylenolpyruvoylglucosamine reductase n=1 Tax=Pontiella desulfatans TaxID=2750659 RepID=A0A6C2U0E0_PONDE|nr:UDP-N-acetylmuramate dehydrogenase [Pontiella desulfatans]VGO12866.1 UDP-N-acetylenolpyruvoylglucosamine reductase [Pontiella desulfatans]